MCFHIITIFPEYFQSALNCGQLKKAIDKQLVQFVFINPRDFARDKHKTVDDRPYGGGAGMVMMLEPLDLALSCVPEQSRKILLSPRGRIFSQTLARDLAKETNLVLICGRYEGIDARVEQLHNLESISVGDYVLNGGECAALNVIEAVLRFIPGFMSKKDSFEQDSFSNGLLEHAHYTRPEVYKKYKIPEVLSSGNHAQIAKWRRTNALETTFKYRPELLLNTTLTEDDRSFLASLPQKHVGKNLYLALLHFPVLDKFKKISTTSLTNLDIHDISRVSTTYGLGGYFLVTPLKDQQNLAQRLLVHWTKGPSASLNPDRAKALRHTKVVSNLEEVEQSIEQKTGQKPVVVATSAKQGQVAPVKIRGLLERKPVLLVFGTGYGLAPEVLKKADLVLQPIGYCRKYNHLSVRSAVAIIIDRILSEFW
ncbi:MAG: tRNA (guanosine(37)-N1)-methyltransferase TrmD [Desulfonauticus sp.]|nr:tRNA (guanosine(37)-N1)-methyltransferase TrmD [Desulfonauticus sp.]